MGARCQDCKQPATFEASMLVGNRTLRRLVCEQGAALARGNGWTVRKLTWAEAVAS